MDPDLRDYARVVWRRRWYGLVALVVCVGLAYGYTTTRTPTYQATTTLFVGERQLNLQDISRGLAVTALSERLLKSYGEILTSRKIADRAVTDSGLPVSSGAVRAGLTVEPLVDTQILKLTYQSADPVLVGRVVNAVASAFVREIHDIDVPPTVATPPPPGKTPAPTEQSPPSAALTVSVVDPAVRPTRPLSPNHQRDLTLGVLLGILVGLGLEFGVDHFDVSVKRRDDTEKLGLPVVGVIPKLDTGGADVYIDHDPQDVGTESFRKLRTSIGFLGIDAPIKTLLVTSPIAGEGKTTVAVNLAVAYAQAANKTLLLEADLRRPSLHRIFGSSGTAGLTTAIIGDVSVSRSLRNGEVPNLQCLVAGAIPPNPVELLESAQMENLLELLRHQFDVIIIDSPPILPVADSIALAGRCDGVVVVARSGSTPKDRLVESVAQIEKSGARFLGVVVNCVPRADSPFDYEYYYTYRAGSPAADESLKAEKKSGDA